jgi:hypothetical protein
LRCKATLACLVNTDCLNGTCDGTFHCN